MLRCEECGKEARTEEEARRWRAYVTVVEGSGRPPLRVRPDCANREFDVDDCSSLNVNVIGLDWGPNGSSHGIALTHDRRVSGRSDAGAEQPTGGSK
jgi:hypothetical protein